MLEVACLIPCPYNFYNYILYIFSGPDFGFWVYQYPIKNNSGFGYTRIRSEIRGIGFGYLFSDIFRVDSGMDKKIGFGYIIRHTRTDPTRLSSISKKSQDSSG